MRSLLFVVVVISTNCFAIPETVKLRPGQTHTIRKKEKLKDDVIVRCVDKPTCVLKLRYVGKMWEVIHPSGKIQGEYKNRADADRELQRLLRIGVCEKSRIYRE